MDDDFENETGSSQESSENVDDRLKALIELMGSRAGNGLRDGSGQQVEKEDTLKYLSQLETVARRLKDQLLSDRKKVSLIDSKDSLKVQLVLKSIFVSFLRLLLKFNLWCLIIFQITKKYYHSCNKFVCT